MLVPKEGKSCTYKTLASMPRSRRHLHSVERTIVPPNIARELTIMTFFFILLKELLSIINQIDFTTKCLYLFMGIYYLLNLLGTNAAPINALKWLEPYLLLLVQQYYCQNNCAHSLLNT